MKLNDAACDVFCQQFDDYERIFACLFPRRYAENRFRDYLFELGYQEQAPDDNFSILVAADWYADQGEDETADLMRLAVQWQLEPPSEALKRLADEVRRDGMLPWTALMRLTEAINAIFRAAQC